MSGKAFNKLFAPAVQGFEVIRITLLNSFIAVVSHTAVGQQEVENLRLFTRRVHRQLDRFAVKPARIFGFFVGQFALVEHLTARAHQRVTAVQLVTKPRYKGIATNGVQPQRHFRQLHRHRV